MSITINTSEYTKTKDITIDGVKLTMRPMSSAETLSLNELNKDMQKAQKLEDSTEKSDKSLAMLEKISKLYFSLFNEPEKAKKLLQALPIESWFEIYNKVMTE